MPHFIATAYKDGQILSSRIHQHDRDYADLTASCIHYELSRSDAVVLQFPKDVSIKLTNQNNETVARIVGFSGAEPFINVVTGQIGKTNAITGTPLAWTENGEILLVKLIADNIA